MKGNILALVLFFFGILSASSNYIESGLNPDELRTYRTKDSLSSDSLVLLEFRYIAPLTGKAYLVWETKNRPLQSVLQLNTNSGSRLNQDLIYTPLQNSKDTFGVVLRVPPGTDLSFFFWITKNKEGHYQDFWDLESSGNMEAVRDSVINHSAVYSEKKAAVPAKITDKSWLILLLLCVVYLAFVYYLKKSGKSFERKTFSENVFFIGLSLFIFHLLARSDIIGLNLFQSFRYYWIPLKVIKAGYYDFIYVFILTAVFTFILSFMKHRILKKWIFGIFIFLAVVSAMMAFINVSTVTYLGKPFNYQWLYYSDFLRSEESKETMAANLSPITLINICSFCIAVLTLAGILVNMQRLLLFKKKLILPVYLIASGLAVILIFGAVKVSATWTRGQEENAVLAMFQSVLTINSNSTFFSSEVPEEMQPFDPKQSSASTVPVILPEEHPVKNLLFVVLESTGAVYFDAWGGHFQITPYLNRYEKSAIVFENAYAHSPSTNRSLVSILGSVYPEMSYKSLTIENPQVEHPTISSVLKSKGYRTSFYSSANLNFQNCREFLAYRDFDQVLDFSMIDCSEAFELESKDYRESSGVDDMCLADCLFSWLDEKPGENFFSLVWTVQGHYPYYFAGTEEDFGVSDLNLNRYLNALKHDDELVGGIMAGLEARGLDSTTLVVVVGDHGEAFGQHGQYGHATALYEENIKVPLYFINPVLFSGQRKNDIAGLKDLGATSLAVLGVQPPAQWQGRNLFYSDTDESFFFAPWSDYLFAYRKGNMKYIFNETRNTFEIFNLKSDPGENINLAGDVTAKDVEFARNRVAAWVQFQDAVFDLNGKDNKK